MKITIKRLEIIFVIVYFLTALMCLFYFSVRCLKGSLAGFMVNMGDWYLLKFMSKRWLKKGKHLLFDTFFRFLIVGISIWLLLKLNFDIIGIIVGVSVIPVSLMVVSVLSLFRKISV